MVRTEDETVQSLRYVETFNQVVVAEIFEQWIKCSIISEAIKMKALLEEIDGLGFYKYADREVVSLLKNRFLHENGFLFDEQTGRVFPFDLEFLAEGGVQGYLESLLPFLRLQKVVISNIGQAIDPEGRNYHVSIDDNDHVIFLQSEFDRADSWGLAAIRTSILVNDLLRRAGSDEVFYVVSADPQSRLMNIEWADTAGAFLTPNLFDALAESGLARTDRWELIELLDEQLLEELLSSS